MRELKLTVKSKFFSIKEIIIYTLIFTGFSVILFPKGKLEEYALSQEKSNITLYVIYIRNLLKIKDDDIIRLHLVGSLTQAGEFQEAELEAQKLLNTRYRDKAYVALYRIEKAKFFAKKDGDVQKMQTYLLGAIKSANEKELLIEINREAISMNLPFVVMVSAEKLYQITGNIEWLKQAYRYAIALMDVEKALLYASELYRKDVSNGKKYVNDAVYIVKNNKEGRSIIQKLSGKLDKGFYAELTRGLLTTPQPGLALNIEIIELKEYEKLFLQARSYKDRRVLFTKIVQMYLWKEDYDGLKKFIRMYYMEFAKDEEVSKLVLKSALATGDPTFAREIAEGIKKEVLK